MQDSRRERLVDVSIPEPAAAHGAVGRDWLLRLATTLQTTLELEALLRLFGQHAAELVPHDGVRFRRDASPEIRIGQDREHVCEYRVLLEHRDLGTLEFSRASAFTARETMLLEDAIANLVHPLQNAIMYREALEAAARDPLTGLNNRSSLQTILEREVELARRHGGELSFLMIDADHFKSVNDRHGHLVGDGVLRLLAARIRGCVRESDIVFRYGGEEFAIVLSSTGAEGAGLLAERVRAAVEHGPLHTHGLGLDVTVSIGAATLRRGEDAIALVARADSALLRAKSLGRNRVCDAK